MEWFTVGGRFGNGVYSKHFTPPGVSAKQPRLPKTGNEPELTKAKMIHPANVPVGRRVEWIVP